MAYAAINTKTIIIQMKRLLILTALLPAFLISAKAQFYMNAVPMMAAASQPVTIRQDTLWGAYCYREVNGQISGSSRNKRPFDQFPLHDGEKLIYYVLAEKCSSSIYLSLHTEKKAQPLISVKITEVNTGKVICNKTIKTKFKGSGAKPYIAENAKFPSKSWYKIELTAQNWLALNSIDYFVFDNESAAGIKPSPIFMAPSVHLGGWESTDPNAPKGEAYDWAYMEVMYPKKYERKNTYIMSLGVLSGYMGIQSVDDTNDQNYTHRVLFSMWDKGDTDADHNLPDYLRSGALDNGDGVKINRFGGEGTGTQSIIYNSHWQCDNWVQFITTCRPEQLNITIKGSRGQDSTIVYNNTLVSAWYKQASDPEWHYLATLREAGRNHYMAGWYSFLENFTDEGGNIYRRAYYRNGYLHSLHDNKWYNRNKVNFTHTQGSPKEPRYDYGHGATDLYPNCFYLEQGGYTIAANDSANTVPLATVNTPVDTINTAALWAQMEQAIRKERTREMDELITNAAEQPDKLAAFKALAKRYIDNADHFHYYAKADLADLCRIYNDGRTTDAAGLAQELRQIALFATPLKCGMPIKTDHIGVAHAYQISETDGRALIANGTDIDHAPTHIATDNHYNWRFIRQGNTNKFYVYNIGAQKYLDLSGDMKLASTPTELTISQGKKEGEFIIAGGSRKITCRLIDNYYTTPETK